MKNELIITADLGLLKAYVLAYDELGGRPKVDLVENTILEGHLRLGAKLSDVAGRFAPGDPHAEAVGARAAGENHNLKLEFKKRIIKDLIQRIERLVRAHPDCEFWNLAIPRDINRQVIESLSPEIRHLLKENLAEDLTKMSEADLLCHFSQLTRA
jgi:hypothetical protein